MYTTAHSCLQALGGHGSNHKYALKVLAAPGLQVARHGFKMVSQEVTQVLSLRLWHMNSQWSGQASLLHSIAK